ncbi:MAG: type I 3-dehydroquinate dehydratase [Gammaproteobacteria bacterium]|nr:type I 3-dehydroquinate dehydratase [Gammaproteobacteria bacterium]
MSVFRPLKARGRQLGDGQVPAICLPLLANDEQALQDELREALDLRPDIVEWRADHFLGAPSPGSATIPASPGTVESVLRVTTRLRELAGELPLIFTLRSVREGGQPLRLNEQDAIALQAAIARSGLVDFLDIELAVPDTVRAPLRAAAQEGGTQVIFSAHDFAATPTAEAMFATLARMAAAGADVAKLAVMPQGAGDVLALLAASERAQREVALPIITMAMGPLGVMSRVFGGLFGSALSFAAGRSASAPGQLPIDELRAAFELVRSRSLPR